MGLVPVADHAVNEAVSLGFFRCHIMIPLGILVDLANTFSLVFGQDGIQNDPDSGDFFRLDFDIGMLSLKPSARLVDHDA